MRGAFAQLRTKSGVTPHRPVVSGYASPMAFWMTVHYGHNRVSWLPFATDVPAVSQSCYACADLDDVRYDIRATHEAVLNFIDDPEHQFMDERGGHLPGAILMPIEQTCGQPMPHSKRPRTRQAVRRARALVRQGDRHPLRGLRTCHPGVVPPHVTGWIPSGWCLRRLLDGMGHPAWLVGRNVGRRAGPLFSAPDVRVRATSEC